MGDFVNEVVIEGKITHIGRLEYTPSGVPVLSVNIATSQEFLGRNDLGYFEGMFSGERAILAKGLKVGMPVRLTGGLWQRKYRNRRGDWLNETKIIVEEILKLEVK